MDISILLKEEKLYREEDITGYLEANVLGGLLMGRDDSGETFGFAMDVIGLTRRPTIVNKLAVIVLQCIVTPTFISLDMIDLVIPYLFAVLLVKMITS